MFGGLTHEPAIELARRLVAITAEPLQHVFFSDSGSVAVEVAAKMALQFWASAGRPGKHRLITWRGGYHGDTLHPMSVCDPVGGMHSLWQPMLPAQVFVEEPPAGFGAQPDPDYLRQWEQALAEHADSVAAIIVEPVVQGAGGMRFSSPAYLTALRQLADRHSVLLIFDEIATGFGRTGALFAADHAGVAPDICCLGKAMTGGYLSMAATLCTSAVAEQISRGPAPVLAHGPTFMANPLAAAISLASIDLLLSQDWQASVARVESGLRRGLAPIGALPAVHDVRVLGAIGVVQMSSAVEVAAATDAAVGQGVWLRPFRDLIYTMPAYLMGDEDLAAVCAGMRAAAEAAGAAAGAA
jgi:adenosylmethionine-8-amino-7-oxononanoate aminotransferase